MGQTFRYSLMMYELKSKIGDTINIHIGGPVFEQCLQIDCASFQSLSWKCRAFKRVILHVTPSVAVVICDRDNNLWLQ